MAGTVRGDVERPGRAEVKSTKNSPSELKRVQDIGEDVGSVRFNEGPRRFGHLFERGGHGPAEAAATITKPRRSSLSTSLTPQQMKEFVRNHFEDFVNRRKASVIGTNMTSD